MKPSGGISWGDLATIVVVIVTGAAGYGGLSTKVEQSRRDIARHEAVIERLTENQTRLSLSQERLAANLDNLVKLLEQQYTREMKIKP